MSGQNTTREAARASWKPDEFLDTTGAPGARDLTQIAAFRDAVIDAGGRGLLMSTWLRTRPRTRKALLDRIRAVGPVYRGEG